MTAPQIPRQDIPEIKKTPAWYKLHADLAEQIIRTRQSLALRMSRNYDSYNGKTEAESIRHLVSTYGKKNRAKYIPYRLSRTKFDIMVGEFLKMPLNATVKTINSAAITEKVRKYELMLGASHAKNELGKLKEVGVDVMEGAEIPDKDDPEAFSKLSFKDKEEEVMQILMNEESRNLSLKQKFSENVLDVSLNSRCCGQIMVSEVSGEMYYDAFDPRDLIAMEYDRDPFYEKTPVMGRLQKMPIHKILTTFKLTDAERNKLDEIRNNHSNYLGAEYRGRYSYNEGEFCADVMHMEWRGVRTKYSQVIPKNEQQLLLDDSTDTITMDLDAKEYEENREKYDALVKSGGIREIITEFEEDMYEVLRIGHDIDPIAHQGRKKFIQRDEDTGKILSFSYYALVFNKVDGDTVSLKEICDPFDTLFDTLMYNILKEINKAKGKVIVYDRAGMDKKTTVKEVLYRALNDSFIDVNSSGAGNFGGKDLNISQVFKEIDLGVSSSFPSLIAMKNDIINAIDMITGINGARDGSAPASSTVTNNMQNLESSRTITEPMFYYITKFCEKVMLGIIETGKLVWGLYQPNKARMILGDERFQFLQVTKNIAWCSYGVELMNPRYEQQIVEDMNRMMELSLNAKEIRPMDIFRVKMQETLASKKAMLEKSWDEINNMRMQEVNAKLKADAENNQKNIDFQIKNAKENREDNQAAKINEIREQGKVDIIVNTAKQKGEAVLNSPELNTDGLSQQNM